MNQTLLALLVGLLAGIAGGFAPRLLTTDSQPAAADLTAGDATAADLGARLERIEAALARMSEAPMRADPAGGLRGNAPQRVALDEAALAELKQATKETVKEALAAHAAEQDAKGDRIELPQRVRRKRMKLADAAAEMGLSAGEEEELRQIYDESFNKALKLLAGEDGDIQAVRDDIAAAKNDPSKRMAVMGKYMPRVLPKIGEFMALQADRQSRVNKAVGQKRANELSQKFDIEEANPMGMGSGLRFEATTDETPVVGR